MFRTKRFSSGALGLGAAVDPKEGVLYAPADGTISEFFPTGHAIGMTTDDGVELLIHVGMDTVQLEGKGFRPFAKEGDRVTKGQKLLEFDMELICKEGYSLVTPVLITNTDEFSDISITSECHIDPQSILMTVLDRKGLLRMKEQFCGAEQQRQISLKEAGIKMEEGLHSLM